MWCWIGNDHAYSSGIVKESPLPPPMPCLRCALTEMTGSMPVDNNPTANLWNRKRTKRIEELKPDIEKLMKEGLSGLKIAKELGIPRSTICNYIKEIKAEA